METVLTKNQKAVSPEAAVALQRHTTHLTTNSRTRTLGLILSKAATIAMNPEIEKYVGLLDLGQEDPEFADPELQKFYDAINARMRRMEISLYSLVAAGADVQR